MRYATRSYNKTVLTQVARGEGQTLCVLVPFVHHPISLAFAASMERPFLCLTQTALKSADRSLDLVTLKDSPVPIM